ncbi:MAG: hypothetical protein ABIG63_11375 [Chloroflexota bacterium]
MVDGFEAGWDYEDPDGLLDKLAAWIEKRKNEQWCLVSDSDFRIFHGSADVIR